MCGSADVEEISRVDRDNNYLRTVICVKCGLAWSDPRPNEDEIKQFYTKDYRIAYKGTYQPKLKHVYRAGRGAANRLQFLQEIIKSSDKVLDVGAGGGEFVYLLRAFGFNAEGIEPNEGYGLYAKTHLNLPVKIGFIQQAELSADHFDIITLHHVLEHLDNPFSILVKIRESLREKGFLVVEVPNIEATCFAPIHRFHAAHLYNFNLETLEAIGSKAGYSVHKTRISADGGVITTIFRKAEKPEDISGEISGNYQKIVKIIERHTSLTHFLTINPYIRPIKKLQMNINEKFATKNKKSGKAVLDSIVEMLHRDNLESL